MKNLICTFLLLTIGAACSKKEPEAVAPAPAETPAVAESPAPAAVPLQSTRPATPSAPPAVTPQTQPVVGVKPLVGRVDPQMTALLKRFVAQKGRLPQSILELAGATSDSFPLAPAGYLYAIDPATSEVKLVKQ